MSTLFYYFSEEKLNSGAGFYIVESKQRYKKGNYIGYKYLYPCVFLYLFIFSFTDPLSSQGRQETGLVPVYNFTSGTYNAQEQNWAITEDNRGVIYIANSSGVLEFDGINWRLIELGDNRARSLATGRDGRIFVGSENELGYLAPDSAGHMRFNSLLSHIPSHYADFQVVWNVFTRDKEVFFQTDNTLFIWNGDSMRIMAPSSRIIAFFQVNKEFYAKIEGKGLMRFTGDDFVLVPGGESFTSKPVYGIIPVDSFELLIASEAERFSFYRLSFSSPDLQQGTLSRFSSGADEYLARHGFFNSARIGGNEVSIGTWGGGLVIMNLKGELLQVLDKDNGIQDPIIQQQYFDTRGNLWLALSKGVSRVEIHSPVSFFNALKGIQGTVQSITRFNNRIYAATNLGISYSEIRAKGQKSGQGFETVFRPVEKLAIECWDLLTFNLEGKELLLVVTNDNISMISEDNKVTEIMEGIIYDIYQSKLDPARVYVGLEDGLTSLYYSKGKWTLEKKIDGINESISNISEDFLGNLWMGTLDQGVIRMNIKSFRENRIGNVEIDKFDTLRGIPAGPTLVDQFSESLIAGTTKGFYRYKSLKGNFEPDSTFGSIFADGSHYIHRISELDGKKIWVVSVVENSKSKYQIGYLDPGDNGNYSWIYKPFTRISQTIQHGIYLDNQNIVWIGGPNGLFRYDPEIVKSYSSSYFTLIRTVTLTGGDTIFGGTGYDEDGITSVKQPSDLIPVLPYAQNSLTFDFSAQSGEDESYTEFSYMLEGYEKKWSEYSSQHKKEYTNLREGSYIMKVKARNVYGTEGVEAQFAFTILSPWYRTWLAYASYFILLGFFIFGIVKVYTRNLRAIIRERTAEVVRQKDEIEEKNKEITDSIHYASRIQSAILPPTDVFGGLISDYFILYMPRDIVSGDFYWINAEKKRLITVAADCTGHGVPGAFMSMLGVAFLNEIVKKSEHTRADEILNQLRTLIIKSLRQTGREGENKDGMDIALSIFDLDTMKLQFAGANNPLLMIRQGEMTVFKADKMPIGIHMRADEPFTLYETDLLPGDIFYSFSDGYVDQFGGPEGKKFLSKQFKEVLLSIQSEPMEKQKQILKETIQDWMSKTFQVDDILVMGIKI